MSGIVYSGDIAIKAIDHGYDTFLIIQITGHLGIYTSIANGRGTEQ